jgi:hypothetical protein
MRTRTIPPPTSPRPGSPGRRGRGAVAGLLACGAALGVAELLAGFVGGQASPLVAVGGAAIDATPQWLKEFAIRAFGERDKLVLLAGIAVVLAGFAVAVGLLAVRWLWLGLAGVALFGAVGAAAALSRPGAGLLDALPSLVGALAGAAALAALAALVRAAVTQAARRGAVTAAAQQRAPFSDPAPGSGPWWGSVPDAGGARPGLSTASAGTGGVAADQRQAGVGGTGGGFWSPGCLSPGGPLPRGPAGGCWAGGRT